MHVFLELMSTDSEDKILVIYFYFIVEILRFIYFNTIKFVREEKEKKKKIIPMIAKHFDLAFEYQSKSNPKKASIGETQMLCLKQEIRVV